MQKIAITLIYLTLAMLVVTYLFKLMYWPGMSGYSTGIFWMHIGSYLSYSFFAKPRENRILLPMIFLVLSILFHTFNVGSFIHDWIAYIAFFTMVIYSAYHLLVKDYLSADSVKYMKPFSYLSVGVYCLSGLLKMAHFTGASTLLIIGSAMVALALLVSGISKGRLDS